MDQAPCSSLGQTAGKIALNADGAATFPGIADAPIMSLITAGLKQEVKNEEIEETFAVGTATTTLALQDIPSGWPRPRVCWRVLLSEKSVIRWWAIAVVLHATWDTRILHTTSGENWKNAALTAIGWYLVFAILEEGLGQIEHAKSESIAKGGN